MAETATKYSKTTNNFPSSGIGSKGNYRDKRSI